MNALKKNLSACLAAVAAVVICTSPVHAQVPHVFPAKECEYENGPKCTGWYPNEYTCKNIANRPHEDWQMRACLAWIGYGQN